MVYVVVACLFFLLHFFGFCEPYHWHPCAIWREEGVVMASCKIVDFYCDFINIWRIFLCDYDEVSTKIAGPGLSMPELGVPEFLRNG